MIKTVLKYLLGFSLLLSNLFGQNNVFVNQSGYLPDATKFLVCNSAADSFYIVDSQTGGIKFASQFSSSFQNDPLSGMDLKIGNFSGFTLSGKYIVETNSGDYSFPFSISDTVYNKVYRLSQKAFYFQRCGTSLLMRNAGDYHHLACHTQDGFYHQSTGLNGFKYAIGGWHDAGDFGKYIVNAGITLGTLMLGYELFPDYFEADDLNIPESGNGIPDLLDEIRYELDWALKMQDTSGGVFTKLTPLNFAPFEMPEYDNATRYLYQISSAATADFAAFTAHAFRVFDDYDSLFAQTCLTASLNAWNYLEEHPNIVPPGGFVNPNDTNTGEYGDSNDKDERLWAAAELFASTNDTVFENYYLSNFNSVGLFTGMSWQWVAPLAHLVYLLNTGSQNTVAYAELKASLLSYVEELKTKMNSNGFRIPLNDGEFYWGSNSGVLNSSIYFIALDYINQNDDNFDYILQTMNYILGCNPLNQSFISGIGTKRLMHPHHRQSESDNILEPVPGLLAGGPNQYLNDATLQALFDENTPPALCYVDSVTSYASNEIAINWNAPLVFVAGYLNGKGMFTSVGELENEKPDKIILYQNFPNPFNPNTIIKFEINKRANVRLEIFDSLGRKIITKINKTLTPGIYFTDFSTANTHLASGVYLYKLTVNGNSLTKKMVLIK